jgi:hypothetical protein
VADETADGPSVVGEVKALVADPTQRVNLFDVFMRETLRVLGATGVDELPLNVTSLDAAAYGERITVIEGESSRLLAMLLTVSFFADREDHDRLIVDVLERLANARQAEGASTALGRLQLLPALLGLYAVGIGATAAHRVAPFARALASVEVPDGFHTSPLAEGASVHEVLHAATVGEAFDLASRWTPISDYLRRVVAPAAESIHLDGERLDAVFDDVEYVLGLVAASSGGYGTIGRFGWRRNRPERGARDRIVAGTSDELLAARLFGGARETLDETHARFEQHITETTRFWR